MIYLVAGILVFEILRLVLQIQEQQRVKRLNERVMARIEANFRESQEIRKAEIEELKELAKGSKFLEGLVTGLTTKIDSDELPK